MKKLILVIEDNEMVRENTAEILGLANYAVITAENGYIGIDKARKEKPDLILCDIMMPVCDGFSVLQELTNCPKTASIPFVFLSSKSEKSDLRKGMNLGADDYLTKPFEEDDLLISIKSRLDKHQNLKKEFSTKISEFNKIIDEASQYVNLDSLTQDLTINNYKKKEVLFTEGSAAHNLFRVQQGSVKTFVTTADGKEFITGLYGPGDYIGQLSLLSDKGKYIESAVILNQAQIFEVPKINFIKLLYENKTVSNKFLKLVSNNLIELQQKLTNMAFNSVRQRTAKALLDLNDRGILIDEDSFGIDIARDDFAGIIGTATETAIRMLTQFKKEGIISIDFQRKIILKDKNRLNNLATFVR
ncbi:MULTISPECIES: response regulator [unclassified Flavobacterium]|uniref:response regulator n=1 Tax=unclassified Flavobacterium TaxID=196869 RepID=UPI003F91414F